MLKLIPFFLCTFLYFTSSKAIDKTPAFESQDSSEINRLMADSWRHVQNLQLDSAEYFADFAFNKSVSCNYIIGQVNALNMMGVINFYSFKYADAATKLEEGQELAIKNSYQKGEADALYWLSYVYSVKGEYKRSIEKITEALNIYSTIKITSRIADCYSGLGYLFEKIGEPEKSPAEYTKALNILIELNDSAKIAEGYNYLGHSYYYLGDYSRAMEQYFTALAIWTTLSDSINIAQAYGSLGSIYLTQENYKSALDYYSTQEKILIKHKNHFELAKATQNIGVTYNYLKKYNKAKIYYLRAISLFKQMDFKIGLANTYKNLAGTYLDSGEFDSAMVCAKQAMNYSVQINSQKHIANNNIQIGQILFQQGKIDLAKKNFEKALKISKAISDLEIEKMATLFLAKIYEIKGSYRKALESKNRHYELVDSLENRENLKKLTQLELRYEFDKEKQQLELRRAKETAILEANIKQAYLLRNFLIIGAILLLFVIGLIAYALVQKRKSNRILNKKKDEIEHKNSLLASALTEKESLLKEIHHRVKNNLQIVSSLLNIQTEYSNDSKIIGAVHESQSRVKAMALIHQLLYQEESFTRINFQNYLEQLTKILENIFKQEGFNVITKIRAEEIALDIDTSIPLGLIVTELVSNAYKYAFNDSKQGYIEVGLTGKGETQYELFVRDNGSGLPIDFKLENSKSMGLKLVKLLSDQIDGELSFQNEDGAQFILVFSENE